MNLPNCRTVKSIMKEGGNLLSKKKPVQFSFYDISCSSLPICSVVNEDGSVYILVGSEALQGWESNWVKSEPGKGWFPYIRCYAPSQAWFDGSYNLPQVEQVDFKDFAK